MLHVMDRAIQLPWWRKPKAKMALMGGGAVLAVLVLSVAFAGLAERSLRVPLADVTVSTVAPNVFHDFVPLHGAVVPRDTIYLDAQVGGQVAKILVQAGDHVVQGQTMLVFRNDQLQLDVLNDEGRLAESLTQIQTQQNQLEAARAANATALANIRYQIANLEHTASRYDPLLKQQAMAPMVVEQTHDQLDYYRALLPIQIETNAKQDALRQKQLPGLQAEEASLQQSLKATRGELDALTEKAPVTGKITVLDLKVGENRNRGERLAEIVAATGFKISADIDEYYLARVHAGEEADVTLNGVTEKLRVTRVYPQVKNGTFTADFAFEGAMPGDLVTGAATDGRLSLGSDAPALILPAGAFLEASGGDYVFVLDTSGHAAHRRRVKLGRRNIEQVEVLSGLSAKDRVITSDYANYDKIDRIDLTN